MGSHAEHGKQSNKKIQKVLFAFFSRYLRVSRTNVFSVRLNINIKKDNLQCSLHQSVMAQGIYLHIPYKHH